MAVFEYKGLDASGNAVAGIIDADSAKLARTRLRKQGVFPTEVGVQTGATKGTGLNVEIDVAQYFQFITTKDVSILTRQMATLLSASVSMSETLNALVDQTEKQKLKVVLSKIKGRVNEGSTLGDALADHPKVFDDLYIHMVRAGEKSGSLDQVLKRLAKFGEGAVKLQGQILSALAYPALMSVVGTLMLMGLFLGVIPRIRSLFDSLGGEESLPLLTRAVFFVGDTLTSRWGILPPLILMAIVWAFRRWISTERGRERWDTIRLKIPVFGPMQRLVAVSRFCRTLATLLISGVPIIDALDIVKHVVGNVKLAAAIEAARVNIQEGQSIAAPLKQSGEFPPLVTHMIAIGERVGELEPMLETVADAYESEVEATMSALTSLMAPVLIMIMGGTIFLVALGLLLPMMNISSMVR